MIRFNFRNSQTRLLEIEVEFNKLFSKHYPELLEWGPFQMAKHAPSVSVQEWKEFRLLNQVDQWYEEEMALLIKSKVMKMLNQAGDTQSTGVAQTLTQTLNYLERNKDVIQDPTVYIYSFIPLTEEEAQAPNVRIVENIPSEISDAIIKNKRN